MAATARKTVARAACPAPTPPVHVLAPPLVAQCAGALRVSSPHDAAEVEAERTAKQVMRMAEPPAAPTLLSTTGAAMRSPYVARMSAAIVQRAPAGPATAPTAVAAGIGAARSAGSPLPPSVRRFMEPRFGADFSGVRIHAGDQAAKLSRQLNARAFTVGNQIFFGRERYQPDSSEGRELIAHELTHTIQQGASSQERGLQRSVEPAVHERSGPQVQRGWLPDPREIIAGKAAAIPGFTMFTVVIGFNPITNAKVDRSAGNILKGAIELIPGGSLITEALDNHGIFAKVSAWAQTQFDAIRNIGANIWNEVENFIKGLGVADLANPGNAWERAKRIVTAPIGQMIAFARNLKDGIVQLVKDAILRPIGAFARTTRGYPLLCSIMGKDPITGDPAPQDPEALMGAFMLFIGEQELWATMKKTNAVARTFAWFKGASAALKGFVAEIPGLFVTAFKSLEILDIVLIPRAFIKLGKVFGGFAGRFVSWGATAVWNLLEIIFDVVKPGVMGYIKRTGAALKGILRNPMPFVGNLVKAAKLGFMSFADNFGGHLKAGLIDWLTGSLAGVYIPKALTLPEMGKLALSVLGITWAGIRAKIVKVLGPTGETIMQGLEKTFDVVVALATGGSAAAWNLIKEKLNDLKDTVVNGIKDFVTDTIVKKAIPKLIAMFIPGAGFVSAILTIYDTVMVFVQKISKIAQVVAAFIDSIVAIAGGAIAGAARRVESILGGLLSLSISLLAGFLGMGKVTDKVNAVVGKTRGSVDKAIDGAIAWIVAKAKSLFAKLFGKDDKTKNSTSEATSKAVKAKVRGDLKGKNFADANEARSLIKSLFAKYQPEGLKSLRIVRKPNDPTAVEIRASASLEEEVAQMGNRKVPPKLIEIARQMHPYSKTTTVHVFFDGGRPYGNSPYVQRTSKSGHHEHAEMRFLKASGLGSAGSPPAIWAEVEAKRLASKNPKHRAAIGQRIEVRMDINRSPCNDCSQALANAQTQNAKYVHLTIAMASVYKKSWDGPDMTSVEALIKMIDSGITLTPLHLWDSLGNKLAGTSEEFEYGGRRYPARVAAGQFLAEEVGVRDKLNEVANELMKRKPLTQISEGKV